MMALSANKASGPSTGYGTSSGITFDRFVRACVAVKTLREAFQRYVYSNKIWSYGGFLMRNEELTRTAMGGLR